MSNLPLTVDHVLEEEFVRLNGTAGLPPPQSWKVRADDILDARALARELKERESPKAGRWKLWWQPKISPKPKKSEPAQPDAPQSWWRKLWKKPSFRIPEALKKEWDHTAVGHDPENKKLLADAVNEILEREQWLFEHPGYAQARKAFGRVKRLRDVDAAQRLKLNRQMFDVLFANYVRSAADCRYAEVVAAIHQRAKDGGEYRTALSISGGGIRSATFALGILQGLAKRQILQTFDFISTVSGGGYIGSWLSSWARRDQWGIRGVAALLASQPANALDSEAPPVKHLRAYSNYLTPRLGLTSADTWALVATYVRNLLLNWLVLVPLLVAVLAVPRLLIAALTFRGSSNWFDRFLIATKLADYIGLGVLSGWRVDISTAANVTGYGGLALLAVGLILLVAYRPVTETRATKKLTDGHFLRVVALPMLAAAILLVCAWALRVEHFGVVKARLTWWCLVSWSTGACLVSFGVFAWKFWSAANVRTGSGRAGRRVAGEFAGAIGAGVAGGSLAWLATTKLFAEPIQHVPMVGALRWPVEAVPTLGATALYVIFGVPIVIGIFFLQAAIFVGASSKRNTDFDREWWARASGWMGLIALAWIVLSAIALYGPVAIYHLPRALSAVGGVAGLFSLLAGKSAFTQAGTKKKGEETTTEKGTNLALGVAVPLFVLYLLCLISLGTTWGFRKANGFERRHPAAVAQEIRNAQVMTVETETTRRIGVDLKLTAKQTPLPNEPRLRSAEHLRLMQGTDPWQLLGLIAVSFGVAILMSLAVGVNVFSMHAMYRNRLVRAYLGASRWTREPNAFSGFDPLDNLNMDDLRPEYFWAHSFADIDHAVKQLPAELKSEMSDREKIDLAGDLQEVKRQALYTSLNRMIATTDLTKSSHAVLRPLFNRRFIERQFEKEGVTVYPSPMPLFCAQDILDRKRFMAAFQAAGGAHEIAHKFVHPPESLDDEKLLPQILAEVNEVIATAELGEPDADREKRFMFDSEPPHQMIRNRLYIESLLPQGSYAPLALTRPLHLVNICLNLTGGSELAWQERKAESFTVSPLSAGNYRLGYRDSRPYGGGISVGTAVTISGAAASPNMGYHSSPALAFLMTVFNVRLGWWLGNPGIAGKDTYDRSNPRVSILPLLYELTGNTNDTYPYVYLSDGGHFENLGLYEMILRRAHRIVVSDAGADPKYAYDDLGNAIRKVKIDLGITITITHMGILPPGEKKPGKYCAVARIDYKEVDGENAVNGELLYLKPVVYAGDEMPRDVLNYSATSSDFPHESTADQFFSESQFESYRRLGEYSIHQIRDTSGGAVSSVAELIESAKRYLQPSAGGTSRTSRLRPRGRRR